MDTALLCATLIDEAIRGVLFGTSPTQEVRLKTEKPDTVRGWDTVHRFANEGVPFAMFLHQRHYGGAFRQLLDATSTRRGNLLEDAVADLFDDCNMPFIRTGSHNQEDIASRLFAVLAGLGWRRITDALGPVVRDTDGRVFFLSNITELRMVHPFPDLIKSAPLPE